MMITGIDKLVGKKVKRIFMNEEYLKFETDKGNIVFSVSGDCCSQSCFYDFIGVKKLLTGNEIVSAKEISLNANDITIVNGDDKDKKSYQESIQVYGFEIVTKDPMLGDVTSVFSFRNYSNGYYGGFMEDARDREVSPEIFDDLLETQAVKILTNQTVMP